MASIFTMLPFSVSNSALPQLAAADYELLVNYEPDAWGHWLFGVSSSSLIDLTQGKALTLAGTAPTYNSTGVVLGGGLNSGLLSDLADGTERTLCAVIKIPDLSSFMGSNVAGNVGASDGFGMFVQKPGANHGILPVVRGATGITGDTFTGITDGNYIFMAISWSATSGNKLNKFLGGKLSGSITSVTAKTASAVNMAFGNVQYTAEIYHSPLEISEGILYDRALSLTEIAAVYARSKQRMATRGITVF